MKLRGEAAAYCISISQKTCSYLNALYCGIQYSSVCYDTLSVGFQTRVTEIRLRRAFVVILIPRAGIYNS